MLEPLEIADFKIKIKKKFKKKNLKNIKNMFFFRCIVLDVHFVDF